MAKSLLLPFGVLVAGVAVGIALMAGHHPMAGMILALGSLPLALIVWVVGGDRL